MTTFSSRRFYEFPTFALILTLWACADGEARQQPAESGPVRSAVVAVSGSISGEFAPADLSEAKLLGRCDPDTFANFGVRFSPPDEAGWRMVGVTIMSEDEIKADQTGPIELDWVQVSFTDSEYNATEFRGPAEFVITSHDSKGPRMSGSVKGRLNRYGGLLGAKVDPDETIDLDFSFDINAACGVAP